MSCVNLRAYKHLLIGSLQTQAERDYALAGIESEETLLRSTTRDVYESSSTLAELTFPRFEDEVNQVTEILFTRLLGTQGREAVEHLRQAGNLLLFLVLGLKICD